MARTLRVDRSYVERTQGSRMSSHERDGTELAAIPPIVELRRVEKSFGAVAALKGVDLQVSFGEVVGLVGDNGAGKSTLMKIVVGALLPDHGQVLVDGTAVSFAGIRDSRKCGIEMLYQDSLCVMTWTWRRTSIWAGRQRNSVLSTSVACTRW